jgi:hypothetical protein
LASIIPSFLLIKKYNFNVLCSLFNKNKKKNIKIFYMIWIKDKISILLLKPLHPVNTPLIPVLFLLGYLIFRQLHKSKFKLIKKKCFYNFDANVLKKLRIIHSLHVNVRIIFAVLLNLVYPNESTWKPYHLPRLSSIKLVGIWYNMTRSIW